MTIHHLIPTKYYTTIGSHEPVLHVEDGDTVVTTTVDARGFDAGRKQMSPRGNPQTGPFFVKGAEPGDTLVVHLDRIMPNRTHGWSANVVAGNVVDPEYVRGCPSGTWQRGRWTARK